MSQPIIEVPNPPASAETQGYYYVYGEWSVRIEAPKISTSLNAPRPQDRDVRMGMNEAIAMHPAIFTVLVQEQRPGYTVKAWSGISKQLFEWWMLVQERKKAATKNGN